MSYSIYFFGFEFYTFSTRDLVARPKSDWTGLLSSQILFFVLMYSIVLPALSVLFLLNFLPWEIATAFVLLTVLEHISTELTRLLVVIEQPLLATAVIFIKQALWAVCFIFAMLLVPDLRNLDMLLLFWIAGTLLSILIGTIPLLKLDWKHSLNHLDWNWIKRGLATAAPLLVSSLAARSLFTLDRYAFESLNSSTLLGAYSVYMGVASAMLSFIESGVFVFYYPKMIKAYKKMDRHEFSKTSKDMFRQSSIWLIALTAGATIAGTLAFPALKEPVYGANIPLFLAITAAMAIYIIGYTLQYSLYTTSQDNSIIIANVSGLVAAVAAFFLVAMITEYWAVTISVTFGSAVSTYIKYRKWHLAKQEFLFKCADENTRPSSTIQRS